MGRRMKVESDYWLTWREQLFDTMVRWPKLLLSNLHYLQCHFNHILLLLISLIYLDILYQSHSYPPISISLCFHRLDCVCLSISPSISLSFYFYLSLSFSLYLSLSWLLAHARQLTKHPTHTYAHTYDGKAISMMSLEICTPTGWTSLPRHGAVPLIVKLSCV